MVGTSALLLVWSSGQWKSTPTKLSANSDAVMAREVSLGLCAFSAPEIVNGWTLGKTPPSAGRPLSARFVYRPIGYDIVAATPSQAKIVTIGGPNSTVRLWDMASGRGLLALNGGQGTVNNVSFSADRTRIVTSSTTGEMRMWDLITGQTLISIVAHKGSTVAAVFSPDGTRIASAGSDGLARIWDAANGRLVMSLSGHKSSLLQVTFNADGTRLASTGVDGAARIWSLSDGHEVAKLLPPGGAVLTAAFSPDSRFLALGTQSGETTIWNAFTGQQLGKLEGSNDVSALAFSPNSTRRYCRKQRAHKNLGYSRLAAYCHPDRP